MMNEDKWSYKLNITIKWGGPKFTLFGTLPGEVVESLHKIKQK